MEYQMDGMMVTDWVVVRAEKTVDWKVAEMVVEKAAEWVDKSELPLVEWSVFLAVD